MRRTMRIVICCDVDPDVLGYDIPASRFDAPKAELSWRGVEENASKAREICDLVEDSQSKTAKITWFVRSDEQMKIIFEDFAYPLRRFRDLWKKFKLRGDEIGWHPHLWRWSDQKQCWYQEISDTEWISYCLEEGHKEFPKLAMDLASVKAGWSFHNNFTMRKVNDLGLMVDVSALPGLRHRGGRDERGSYFVNEYDWSITPDKPYFPSEKDFRRPTMGNEEKSLRILELPVTVIPKSLGRIRGAYVANVTSTDFQYLAEKKFRESEKSNGILVAFFHPIDLFKPKANTNFKNNLKTLTRLSRSLKTPFAFLTAREMAKEFLGRSRSLE